MTTWEYATAPLISHALQQILNQWGSQGWELVQVVEHANTTAGATGAEGGGRTTVAYFKRPVDGGDA